LNIASYPPLEERNRLVSSIESTSSTLSYSLSWQRFLTLEGARLPYEGDSLHYPPGTTLESLRQGLLTFNTYVSTLRLPTDYRPEPVEVWSEGSISPLGSRRFFVGQWVDALDTVSKWLEATVIAVNGTYVYIHYNGWPDKWDEWIHIV
jgi:singapore isolate B (sub-type 7) whole genome shotgun sequence assembly, scaffold_6